ncbi:MAG: peptidylprolyl isomerase [Desulfobacterales bacterium]
MRIIANTVIILSLAFLLASPACTADEKESKAEEQSDSYIAIVNGKKIPQKTLDQKLELIKKRAASSGQQLDAQRLASIKEDMVNNIVEKELLYQKSQELGMEVEPDTIDSQMEQFKQQFPDEEQYKQQLSALGYTEDLLRSEIETNMAIQKLIEEEIASDIEITDEDLKAYYENNPDQFETPDQVKARHILIKTDEEADEAEKEAARQKIQELEKQIEGGEKFSEVAKEESECPSSERGGDLGYFSKGQMVKPFEEAAFSLSVGDVSDIVETRFGYHLIKAEDKKEASKKTFDEVKDQIKEQLEQQKVEEQLPSYVENLKEAGDVEINMPESSSPSPETTGSMPSME